MMKEISINENDSGQRVDKFLKKYLNGVPAGLIYKMMRKKKIKVNGKKVQPSDILNKGDVVHIFAELDISGRSGLSAGIRETGIDFRVVYEDKNIVIVDKPAGLLSHSAKRQHNSLIDQVIYYLYSKGDYSPEEEQTFAPALCNRLDRNTGGLVIAAKNFKALQDMNHMIREKWVGKYYKAIVKGIINRGGRMEGFLIKEEDANTVKISDKNVEGSKSIYTEYRPLKTSGEGFSLLEIKLITGRPHQIRAHLAHSGHPVVGDSKYGDKTVNRRFKSDFGIAWQLLYANKLVFEKTTPFFDYLEGQIVTTGLPEDFSRTAATLFPGE